MFLKLFFFFFSLSQGIDGAEKLSSIPDEMKPLVFLFTESDKKKIIIWICLCS